MYLSNENVASSIQTLYTTCLHSNLHEPCNLLNYQLHDTNIITEGDDGTKENDDWENLKQQTQDDIRQ